MTIQRKFVSSSHLRSVGYDENIRILEVEFTDHSVYQYHGVPKEIHRGLMTAPSHGKYFDLFVKKRGYQFIQIK